MDSRFGSLWDEVDSRESDAISIELLFFSADDGERLKGVCWGEIDT